LVKAESIPSANRRFAPMSISLSGYRFPRVLLAVATTVVGLCAFASSSQAACNYPDAEQVFSQWGDNGYYELAPDGGFEGGGSGWAFGGGAALVAANESEYLNEATDQSSLSLPYRGTATSPRFCVDRDTPTFRFMTLNAGDDHAKLRVTVSYETGREIKTRITELRAGDEWQPTEPLQLDSDSKVEWAARISFTPSESGGQWLLDDLFIDPFARR
jgi:hypothetical protein